MIFGVFMKSPGAFVAETTRTTSEDPVENVCHVEFTLATERVDVPTANLVEETFTFIVQHGLLDALFVRHVDKKGEWNLFSMWCSLWTS